MRNMIEYWIFDWYNQILNLYQEVQLSAKKINLSIGHFLYLWCEVQSTLGKA